MARTVRVLLLLCAVLPFASASRTGLAGPPPPQRDLPGGWAPGHLRARWIAPYVRHVETMVAGKSASRVTWFGPDGLVTREVEGLTGEGFVRVPGEGRSTVHATMADWTIQLPDAPPGTQTYVHMAGPRVFVRDTWTDDGHVGTEIFTDGTVATRLGPFLRYRADTFEANEDGSLAVLIRATAASALPRIAAFAPGGVATFEADCTGHALIVAVAPGGEGVLIEANDEGRVQGRWSWVTKAGYVRTIDLGANAHLMAWVPDTSRALIACAGEDPRATFRLVDFAEGRVLWEVQDAAMRAAYRSEEEVTIEGGHVLLAGIECHVVEGTGHWRRSVYALDLATGKATASWRSPYRGPPGYSALRFVRVAGRLCLVSDEEFAPFPMADMASRTNGWRAGT